MNSFRSFERAKRNGTAGNSSYGGPGHVFCERHRQRYRLGQMCTECLPGYRPSPKPRRRR
ncbi:hypothetical protein L2Y96_17925 [Luteibacter aegosomaticola]|uniref:hypothetical protein n=1 Tax=Luteibacter aegosomaticola TaxID=2911538 RepID=UPI001FFB3A02|nr:hypothetical protein [Luteibacter aegosomaticola]UPG89257.1 hypothetical protein L2Y96_17925 [Luteibacter aegosomaticola]